MAVAAITYADVKEYIRDWAGAQTSAADIRAQLRAIEDGVDEVMNLHDWPWNKSNYQITTIGGRRFTLAATLDNGDTTATATGTPFTSNELVGRWLVVEGGNGIQFQVKSNTTSVITFTQQFSGETIASGETCVVYCPSYALPDYFGALESVYAQGVDIQPQKLTQNDLEALRARPWSAGKVRGWFVGSITPDGIAGPAQPSLWLWPHPLGPAVAAADDDDPPQVFKLVFRRKWGWWDATSRAWKMVPTADTDILDFPETQRGLLRSVIRLAMAREYDGDTVKAEAALARKIGPAIARSDEDATPFQMLRSENVPYDNDWSKTINWWGPIVIREEA